MMDAIAHQWKQPLSIVSLSVDMLSFKDNINEEYIKETRQEVKKLYTK